MYRARDFVKMKLEDELLECTDAECGATKHVVIVWLFLTLAA